MIWKKWRNLKLQNQILMTQSLVIVSIICILILLSLELVHRFSIFIQHELFQTLILKSMVNTIQLTTKRVNQIKQSEQFTQIIDRRSLENLYFFYDSNDIQMNSQIDDCLQSQYSEQFYSYQYCYGIYGQLSNSTDLSQIKDLIALYSLFLPFNQNRLTKNYYLLYLDESQFVAQYQGEYLTSIDTEILDVFNYMILYDQPGYYAQVKRNNRTMWLILYTIPGTKIAAGAIYKDSEDEFNKISQQDTYFSQRELYIWESGELMYDSINSDYEGVIFQNISFIGFDEIQFQKIKNFTYENLTADNECAFHSEKLFLCLVDKMGQPKIIQAERYGTNDIIFYQILLLDAKSSVQTIDEFQQKLKESINQLILNILIYLIVTLGICFVLSMVFIRKLNKPLKDLEDIAQFHINNEQYNTLTGLSVIQQQNQIQKLANAFFNLINLNQVSKNNVNLQIVDQTKKINYCQGLIEKRYQLQKLNYIRQKIAHLNGYYYY